MESVQVRFVTKHEQYALSSNEFDVPSVINRKGLSDALNSALELDPIIPFDFKLNGNFLRSSLKQAMKANQISFERLVVLEYFPAFQPPEPQEDQQTDDWISTLMYNSENQLIYGLYDGLVSTLGGTQFKHHQAVKSLSLLNNKLLIGDIKGSVSIVDQESNLLQSYSLHRGAINSIATNPSVNHLFITAGDDKSLSVWSTSETSGVPLNSFIGHKDIIRRVVWPEPEKAYSCSMDRSVRVWDVNTQSEICDPIYLNSPVLDCSVFGNMVVAAHTDRSIDLLDTRVEERRSVVREFKSHQNWVSCVQFITPDMFVSGSYDGSAKVWNIGTSVPLCTLCQHDEKILAVAACQEEIAVGGSAHTIRRFRMKDIK